MKDQTRDHVNYCLSRILSNATTKRHSIKMYKQQTTHACDKRKSKEN